MEKGKVNVMDIQGKFPGKMRLPLLFISEVSKKVHLLVKSFSFDS